MTSNRTLITLVVRDNDTNNPETITIFAPIQANQVEQLNAFVSAFCLAKNLSQPISVDFTSWAVKSPLYEYQCEVCGQECIRQGVDSDGTAIGDNFCSNFCRSRHESNESK